MTRAASPSPIPGPTAPALTAARRRLALALVLAVVVLGSVWPDAGAATAPGDVAAVAGRPRADCLDTNVDPPQAGAATAASFDYSLRGVVVDAAGSALYLAENRFRTPPNPGESSNDDRVWRVSLTADTLASAAGGGLRLGDGTAADANIEPKALAMAPNRPGRLHFLDQRLMGGALRLSLRTLENGAVSTVADLGPTPGTDAALAADARGGVYVSDADELALVVDGVATALPWTGGSATAIAVDGGGTTLYVVEKQTGRLSTIDLSGGATRTLRTDLSAPTAVATDLTGSRLFVAEYHGKRVVELDPATGKLLQPVPGAFLLKGPTGLSVVTRPDDVVDVYVQDGDSCAVYKVDRLARYVPPATNTTQATTATTLPDGDGSTTGGTTPTIPSGQIQPDPIPQPDPGPQPQTQPQPQPQIQPQTQVQTQIQSQPQADLGTNLGSNAGTNLGANGASAPSSAQLAPSGGQVAAPGTGLAGGENATAGAQSNGAPAPVPPPPAPTPASGPALGGLAAPGGGQAAVAGDQPTLPRGATRYAMVARRGLSLGAALAGMGVIGVFVGALCLAARVEPAPPAPSARRRCHAKGAY